MPDRSAGGTSAAASDFAALANAALSERAAAACAVGVFADASSARPALSALSSAASTLLTVAA